MAAPTNTLTTYGTGALKEDLSPVLTRLDATETPLFSWLGTGTAKNDLAHDWMTVDLRAPRRTPAPEGNDPTLSTAKAGVRLSNACEIAQEAYGVSGTSQAVDSAGGIMDIDEQRLLKGLEIRRDVELALLGPQAKKATDPREMAGIQAFAGYADLGTGATNPGTGANAGTVAVVYGTGRNLTVDLMQGGLRNAFTNGARISLFFMSGRQKENFDTQVPVESIADNNVDVVANGIVATTTVAIWKSTFGDVKVVMDPMLDIENFAVGTQTANWGEKVIIGFDERDAYRPKHCPLPGRSFIVEKLGKTGDNEKEMMNHECTLEVPSPKAVMVIGGLNQALA